jgi:hypothetical protein
VLPDALVFDPFHIVSELVAGLPERLIESNCSTVVVEFHLYRDNGVVPDVMEILLCWRDVDPLACPAPICVCHRMERLMYVAVTCVGNLDGSWPLKGPS